MAAWTLLVRDVARSVVDLLRLELADLASDLGKTQRRLIRALGLAGLAVMLGFWALGLLVATLVLALGLLVPAWAAALIVLSLFLLSGWLVVRHVLRELAAIENPLATARRHLDDHLGWWQNRLADLDASDVEPEVGEDGSAVGAVSVAPGGPWDGSDPVLGESLVGSRRSADASDGGQVGSGSSYSDPKVQR